MSQCTEPKVSPMMAQWHACKKLAKNAVLLFRMGDFYEAFYDDAELLARELELTLTKRQGIPMSGVPQHTCETYIDRLVSRGYRVAVAEQTEDPKKTKGLVKREIVRVVTPGTLVNSSLLSEKTNNFFAALSQVGDLFGLAYIDLSTGEFRVIELSDPRELQSELYRMRPAEYLTTKPFEEKHQTLFEDLKLAYNFLTTAIDDWYFDHQTAYDALADHFGVHSLDGFGLKGSVAAINAAGALLVHLRDNLSLPLGHVRTLRKDNTKEFLSLDHITQRNLELTESLHEHSKQHTLLHLMDHTGTAMGGRLLRQWIKQPLLCAEAINARLDSVQELVDRPSELHTLREQLSQIRDLERIMMKITASYAGPRDLVSLRRSLEPLPALKELFADFESKLLRERSNEITDFRAVTDRIATALVDEPPLKVSDGGIVRSGFHAELDDLRQLSRDSKQWLADYQVQLREETGIKTLKVGYNRVFGYYIEVSKGQSSQMPDTYTRRQTLANNERFVSPTLKEFEQKVLTAEEKIAAIESDVFNQLRDEMAEHADAVFAVARAIAHLDCLVSLATLAQSPGYCRPTVNEGTDLRILQGRHPVIESVHLTKAFVPNDTVLNPSDRQVLIITGPNMAGKSTYIRQTALLVIMAQIGSFIPAAEAEIGVVDKVFTRIGASDDLSRGQSTFMVEMTETANILNNATSRSLVILDEIGRGTSTYDGISIAWAVAEHLLKSKGSRAKTLFATHYWELTQLEQLHPHVKNYHVAVRECEDDVIFLHKIVQGNTDKSYGIHVGRLAGLPLSVINRAKEVLSELESTHGAGQRKHTTLPQKKKKNAPEVQYLLFSEESPGEPDAEEEEIIRSLKELDLNHLTPMQAMNHLSEWVHKLTK